MTNMFLQDENLSDLKEDFGEDTANKKEKNSKKTSQASLVIELVKDFELFHDKQKNTYISIESGGHQENWSLNSQDFKNWLSHQFWLKHGKAVSRNVLQNVLSTLEGKARFEGVRLDVYTRVAVVNDSIYVDLVNMNWEVIQITKGGWKILNDSSVKFIRTNNMLSLPIPIHGGNIDLFWKHVNIPFKYRKLVLAFLLECFRLSTPFPLLILQGSQGSGKSITQEKIRMLIDPSINNLRTAPKKPEDLLIAAANGYVVSYNNISHLSAKQQDDLCSVATGGALSTRQLYTTCQEKTVDIKRPVIMNGIGDLITAQDLVDRCMILELPEINPKIRKTEEEIKLEFQNDYPAILGSLFSILSQTLTELPNVKLDNKPRMADFALLGTALEKVMSWEKGSFIVDYIGNRKESMANALEHSPVAIALICFIEDECNHPYSGNYKTLYEILNKRYKPDMFGWVKSPKGLANQIKRQKTALEAVGIEIILDGTRHKDGYHVCIRRIETNVHQVHQVQQLSNDVPVNGELSDVHIDYQFPSSPQLCHENRCQYWEDEHDEHGVHKKPAFNNEQSDREVVML